MKNAVEQPPPKGAWFHRSNAGFSIGCSRCEIAACFVAVPAIFLGGFFIWMAILMLVKANNGWDRATASGIFILFVAFCYLCVAAAYQRITVTVKNNRGKVFTGLWPLGFSQRFDWDKVASISLRRTSILSRYVDRSGLCVAIRESQGERYVLFAFRAKLDKQKFIVRQLQKMRMEYISGRSHPRTILET
jgi:hypothetical protein